MGRSSQRLETGDAQVVAWRLAAIGPEPWPAVGLHQPQLIEGFEVGRQPRRSAGGQPLAGLQPLDKLVTAVQLDVRPYLAKRLVALRH